MAERAERKAESRRRLALAGAGVNDEQTLLENWLRGDLGVLHGLALGHLGFVAVGGVVHVRPRGERMASRFCAGAPAPVWVAPDAEYSVAEIRSGCAGDRSGPAKPGT